MIKKGLGKGLGALILNANDDLHEGGITELRINEIEPNLNQPRKKFDDEKLHQLAESIKKHGVVQPIIVKKEEGTYRIVAGERRWRAARIAGLHSVPVVVRELSNRQVMEVALIENLQREDLNPIEEAEAYDRLIKEFEMTQEELAGVVGKSRPAVTNSLRLLNLSDRIKGYLINEELSSGHARTLLVLEDVELQEKAAQQVMDKKLNVRDTEKLVKQYLTKKPVKKIKTVNEDLMEIEDRFKNILGTKVKLLNNNKKGKIMIEYYSFDELERITELIFSIVKK